MKPHVLSLLPREEVILFRKIEYLIGLLPEDLDLGQDERGKKVILSCHILAHALALVCNGVKAEDGYFYPQCQHSWLTTVSGHVIDVYPVGILGGPLLLEATAAPMSPGKYLYETSVAIAYNVAQQTHVQKAIQIVEIFLRESIG